MLSNSTFSRSIKQIQHNSNTSLDKLHSDKLDYKVKQDEKHDLGVALTVTLRDELPPHLTSWHWSAKK